VTIAEIFGKGVKFDRIGHRLQARRGKERDRNGQNALDFRVPHGGVVSAVYVG
jgi:hypothetical protein